MSVDQTIKPKPLVLVLRGDSYKAVGEMFAAHGYDVTYDSTMLSTVNLVCFTGGSDVSPYIYGEEPNGARGCDPVRDEIEVSIYNGAQVLGIPCVGICRGGQLLNVLNGGSMIQHLGETFSGDLDLYGYRYPRNAYLAESLGKVRVDHHQGIVAKNGAELAWPSGFRHGEQEIAYEAWYPETKSLCFQGHPEWGHKGTEDRFFELMERYIGR
jgi:GMP synthase-like glutamine amidotransferase